ncbi:hypothetical protein [Maricaulis sp.]|uniref:hypothetical protein n=1 Tax=Maricaulis sp. TaxID=1486257 RepID=UPI003A8FF841
MKFRAISLLFAGASAACQSLPDGPPVVETVRFERAVHFETGEPLIGAKLELVNQSSEALCVTLPAVNERSRAARMMRSADPEIADAMPLRTGTVLGGPSFIVLTESARPNRTIRLLPGEHFPALHSETLVPGAHYRVDMAWAAVACPDELIATPLSESDRIAPIVASGPSGRVFQVPER